MRKTILLLFAVASCAGARIDRQQGSVWCLPDTLPDPGREPDPAWVSLPENAAAIARPEIIRSLLPILERNALVEVTRARAEEVAGPLPSFDGGYYYLTRGGVVGGGNVTVEEYLRNAGSAISVRASIDPVGRGLLVETAQLAPILHYRNVAVIVWTPSRVTKLRVRCHSAA